MSLLSNLRERRAERVATAIPAISATRKGDGAGTVAKIATVAVANLPESETYTVTHFAWLMHFIDQNPLIVTFSPEISHAGALACHPDAVAAEPMPEPPRRSATASEAATLRQLIEAVYQDDSADDRKEALAMALADPEGALTCYKAMADERGLTLADEDDRRTCTQCANLVARRCLAAKRGEIVASPNYKPIRDMLKRCEGYAPGADEPDRRHGRERWPGLIHQGEE